MNNEDTPMSTLNVGIVGTGWVSGEHIVAFQNNPNTQVVTLPLL